MIIAEQNIFRITLPIRYTVHPCSHKSLSVFYIYIYIYIYTYNEY
jgi:hypothetical protein